MQRLADYAWRWPILAGCLTLLGCEVYDPPRYQISGTVTFDGKRVPFGSIAFDAPTAGYGGGFAGIADGKFDTQPYGRGHLGGLNHILVVGFDRLEDPNDPDSEAIPMFKPYEFELELPRGKTTVDIEVPLSLAPD